MSGKRGKKGFKKLAPSDELAVHEVANLDSGSELELMDLTSEKHRRDGGRAEKR